MSTNNKRIVLAGGSGFIGSALAADWLAQNGEVVVLTRSPHGRTDGVIECEWDGEHLGEWIKYLEEAEAVIGLAGKNINCRHTPDNVQDLADSRVKSVRAIAVGLDHATRPPRVWIQASGIGFYGDQQDKLCDENSPTGSDALAGICCQWEGAFYSARPKKTRKVLLRIGFALGRNGGGLPVLAKLTKWFLGGRAGSGRQFLSWIHVKDLVRMCGEVIVRDDLSGVFNAVAPNAVTNKEFMRELRRALHRPWSPPAPALAIRLGARLMKSDPSLALSGCRVAPRRFLDAGFQFQYPELRRALNELAG